jgi:hypothetical protein
VKGLLDVGADVIAALDAAGVTYSVGGSLARAMSGAPRAAVDVDRVVNMRVDQVSAFIEALGADFYADPSALMRAAKTHSAANVIHQTSGIKVDLFVAGSRLERKQLERRRRVTVSGAPPRQWFLHTPEDILLQKLWWFRQGGETSERQWRDVVGILLVQGSRLDDRYLSTLADEVGIEDLLARARRDATS